MNKKSAIIAAVLVIAVIAAIAVLTNVNVQRWNDAAQSAQLSKEDKETIDKVEESAKEFEALQSEAEAEMQEIDKSFDAVKSLMGDYNASVKSGSPDKAILHEIATILGVDDGDVSAMLENGKFGKKADDALIVMKGQRLLEADEDAYEKAKELAGSGE